MTETSTLMPNQLLTKRLAEAHPSKQILLMLDRLEVLEEIVLRQAKAITPVADNSRSERMKAAWIIRKARKAKQG